MEQNEIYNVSFRHLLGSLIDLSSRTRPDSATAVSMLGKFQSDPSPQDCTALKHLVCYVKGTVHFGILLSTDTGNRHLEAWSDADWGRDEAKRSPGPGYVPTFASEPVLWSSRLQCSTAQSTFESEFAALTACVREVFWLPMLLDDVGEAQKSESEVLQANLEAITWTDYGQGLQKVKHVALRYHDVCSVVEEGSFKVVYTPSCSNRADSLTKILGSGSHDVYRELVGVVGETVSGAC